MTGNSSPIIIDNIISDNRSPIGGGLSIWNSSPKIETNSISSNAALGNYNSGKGGGMEIAGNSSPIIINNIFLNNSSNGNGGGIYLDSYSENIIIGGEIADDKNTICGNYKTGEGPVLDQQIRDKDDGDLYETYKGTNFISAYCE